MDSEAMKRDGLNRNGLGSTRIDRMDSDGLGWTRMDSEAMGSD
jgi:hypothetical protein